MLTNEALGLGKLIDEMTIVQKILRSLPKRFQEKTGCHSRVSIYK